MYQYFVKPNHKNSRYTESGANAKQLGLPVVEREAFDGLWRYRGTTYEYFSMLDQDWHPEGTWVTPLPASADPADWPLLEQSTGGPRVPSDSPSFRLPIDESRAAELVADPQHFARYWVEYSFEGERFSAVHRLINDPGRFFESHFGRAPKWSETNSKLRDFLVNGPHQSPNLVEIEPAEAERQIEQTFGVTGATQWWPRIDPDVVRFVVSERFAIPGRGTVVAGRLEHGVVRPPVEVWWRKDHTGRGHFSTHHLPVVAVEFPTRGSTARGEVNLLLDHSNIELDTGQVLYTSGITTRHEQ
ncbi:hypothetical protein [Kribbella sp. NPDC055071]